MKGGCQQLFERDGGTGERAQGTKMREETAAKVRGQGEGQREGDGGREGEGAEKNETGSQK